MEASMVSPRSVLVSAAMLRNSTFFELEIKGSKLFAMDRFTTGETLNGEGLQW